MIILCYHRTTKRGEEKKVRLPGNCVDENDFDEQMCLIKTLYNPISQEQLINCINGKEPLPPYPVLVTFDDGYKDVCTNAYPILKNYQIPAVIFLTSGYTNGKIMPCDDYIAIAAYKTGLQKIALSESEIIRLGTNHEKRKAVEKLWDIWNKSLKTKKVKGREEYLQKLVDIFKVDISSINNLFMTWEEIRKLDEDGMAFGSHTVKHEILSSLSDEEVFDEIVGSKQEIEKHLNKDIVSFAYPNGKYDDYNQKSIDILKENGFVYAVTTELGTNSAKNIKIPYELRRVCISYNDSLNIFKTKISGWVLTPYIQRLLS